MFTWQASRPSCPNTQFLKLDTKCVRRQQPKLHIYSTGAGKYIFTQPVLGSYFKEVHGLYRVFFKVLMEYWRAGSSLDQGLSVCLQKVLLNEPSSHPKTGATFLGSISWIQSSGVLAIERIRGCDKKKKEQLLKWLWPEIFPFLTNIIAPKQLFFIYVTISLWLIVNRTWVLLYPEPIPPSLQWQNYIIYTPAGQFFSAPTSLRVTPQLHIKKWNSILQHFFSIPNLVLCEVNFPQTAFWTCLKC